MLGKIVFETTSVKRKISKCWFLFVGLCVGFFFSGKKHHPSFSADGEQVLLASAGNLQALYEGGISAVHFCSPRQK